MTALSNVTIALERCWTAIRTVHPDVRPAALAVYLHPAGDRRGHYSEQSWTTAHNGNLDEVHVSAHILKEGATGVFRTLLHEACHSIATTRKIQEVSRQGRYHNAEFAKLAIEVGLIVGAHPGIGAITLGMTAQAQGMFANALDELEQALDLWRELRPAALPGPSKKPGGMQKMLCPSCKRVIRASQKTIDCGPIVCGPCKCEFILAD